MSKCDSSCTEAGGDDALNVSCEERFFFGGYISVYSALISGSRPVYRVMLDRERFDKVRKDRYRLPEKRQYSLLKRLCSEKKVPVVMEDFSGKESVYGTACGGIAAEVGARSFLAEEEMLSLDRPYLAVLDGIEDPYNFGQVLRSFYASGVDGVIVPVRNFFSSSAIVARASAGASELLKVCVSEDLTEFCEKVKKSGAVLYATAAAPDALDLYKTEYKRPLCVVFGGERRGISGKIAAKCDAVLRIPYPRNSGVSLSASSAAAVIAFEIGRRIS